jgi:hypothetical protein
LGGRDPQILKWVRVREGKEWEWEGKTPRFQNRLTPLNGITVKLKYSYWKINYECEFVLERMEIMKKDALRYQQLMLKRQYYTGLPEVYHFLKTFREIITDR